ncbi:unnamed protein product [Notodromas monacha]|uniref:Glycoside hydrolase 35 catalytic domain-containing protein n=1 Tax=Notodromas monacha TaxID=399045 RepID=A0A7R9BPY5_9CRUS|nr:unnamed protein product [Notodromas monacha]CAG0918671.1 unnamed protein product [Notodromas monacha]
MLVSLFFRPCPDDGAGRKSTDIRIFLYSMQIVTMTPSYFFFFFVLVLSLPTCLFGLPSNNNNNNNNNNNCTGCHHHDKGDDDEAATAAAAADGDKEPEMMRRFFSIDWVNGTFVKDGRPGFRIVSGSLHYFRVPRAMWSDRLARAAAMGLNAVFTPVPWNWHQHQGPGHFDFQGDRDLFQFLRLAHAHGLLVLLGIGPGINSDWDAGGIPAWLLFNDTPTLSTRSTLSAKFTQHAEHYLAHLLARLRPLLYNLGRGPVAMLQLDNRYGSFSDVDPRYMPWLVGIVKRHLDEGIGNSAGKSVDEDDEDDDADESSLSSSPLSLVMMYTSDAGDLASLARGSVAGALPGVDCSSIISQANSDADDLFNCFANLTRLRPGFRGPLFNTAFRTDDDNSPFSTINSIDDDDDDDDVIKLAARLETWLLANGSSVSVNVDPVHGGTTFGWWAGGRVLDHGTDYRPSISSVGQENEYCGRAPLAQNGDCGTKCVLLANVIRRHAAAATDGQQQLLLQHRQQSEENAVGLLFPVMPLNRTQMAYGTFMLRCLIMMMMRKLCSTTCVYSSVCVCVCTFMSAVFI